MNASSSQTDSGDSEAAGDRTINTVRPTRRATFIGDPPHSSQGSERDPAATDPAEPKPPATPPTDPTRSPRVRKGPKPHGPIPEDVRHQFLQVGNIYHFRDGAPAFTDHGKRLSTMSENTVVIDALVAIAQARGWERLSVSGTERFRREVWREASERGLRVSGYIPTEVEKAKLAQALAVRAPQEHEPASGTSVEEPTPGRRGDAAPPPATPRAEGATHEPLVRGRLLESGHARYRHEPRGARSFFVNLETASGRQTLWGRDLERALTQSSSHPLPGDEIGALRTGRDPVTLRVPELDASGKITGTKERVTYRTRWAIEKWEVIESRREAAQRLREAASDLPTVAQTNPELVGAALRLRQAELLAARNLSNEVERAVFLSGVRTHLAARLERGLPVPAPELRAARTTPEAVRIAGRERGALER